MKLGNAAFELADMRAEQEREAGISRARSSLVRSGASECSDCGDPIDVSRRIAMPSADTCLDCQRRRERLRWRR